MKAFVLSLIACLVMVVNAQADFYGPGAGIAITDNTTNSSTINAVNILGPNIVTFDSVTVTVSNAHQFIGDVTATITAPNGDNVQLFRRPGTSGFGSNGNWTPGNYTFVLSGGLAMPNSGNVAPGTYNITNNLGSTQLIPVPDLDNYSVFAADNINGIWTFSITDSATGDTGAISQWGMNITSIPEQSTCWAVGLIGLASMRGFGVRCRARQAASL